MYVSNKYEISVIVPVYNSEASISELVNRIDRAMSAEEKTFEIILVNDGSHDCSWNVICDSFKSHHNIRGINLLRNYGQHNALLCGVRAANGLLCVTMDDDLQHPPEELPRLLKAMKDGVDVVYGTPETEDHGLLRDLASKTTKWALQSAMGANTARRVSAFRVFRTALRKGFENFHGPFVSLDVLLTWSTNRFSSINVKHEPRRCGKSNYTVGKLIIHALNMMTGFSVMPLRVASVVGFTFTLVGIAVLLFVLWRYFVYGVTVPGFPFLASIIAIFAGAQLFSLGIIGEYLARMYFRTMNRPAYIISEAKEHPE